ncbi:DUF2199 domain-containing protein [Asticcacaulis sp. AC402]|uniref:DUF2199 domain-containing protein n=1 Tax=Asticcacaulis sp. AC402 TaxID=1282361 RepID=UPI0003C3C41E|nr:DUF2199 domain-containing protein [Asticcacaulis sp. AC402]ESQ75772.1 hypothetical protein ABAC402_07340 [Asticcacaulis sp. AC402]
MFRLFKRNWSCKTCGKVHDDLPICFGVKAPWLDLVPEEEFEQRVDLTNDQCVVDETVFFIRGLIEIPILGHGESLAFSVWSSLSRASFDHMTDRWNDPGRANDPPYFGWLSSTLPPYPTHKHLPLSVQVRDRGMVPLFIVVDEDHALAVDQQNGITVRRWHEIALSLLV